jgi:Fe-only nitrogenase accessory protein AnfO
MEIGVLLDEKNNVVSFNEGGIIKIYSKKGEEWIELSKIYFSIDQSKGLKEVRKNIRDMVDKLGNCKVFAAEDVTGLPYTILESMGFNIWRVSGGPEDFLDYIEENEKQVIYEKPSLPDIPTPIEKDEKGYYYIDLRKVMEHNERVTSKQVLLPFFHNTDFLELEIDCTHVPPWFEVEFKKLNFNSCIKEVNKNKFNIKVVNNGNKLKK